MSLDLEDGYMVFADWVGPKGHQTLRHAAFAPTEGEMFEHGDLVTFCGRAVPADAHLEAMRTHQAHDMDVYDRCTRCKITRYRLAKSSSREALFHCYPTDCMICHEQLLDPERV